MSEKVSKSRLEIHAKPMRGWLFWGGWVALFLSPIIFLTLGGLVATPDGLPFSGSQMIIGGVLLLLLVALDAVIACGLFQIIQESRTLYLCDDAGICQIRPFSRLIGSGPAHFALGCDQRFSLKNTFI
jgi:hypothetical protein